MKRLVPFACIVVLCILSLAACSSEDASLVETDNRPTIPTSASNAFTVNGDIYVNAAFRGYTADSLSSATVADGATSITWSGLTPSSEEFAISINLRDTVEGEYRTDERQRIAISMTIRPRTGNDRSYILADGIVVIEDISRMAGRVTGSFSGTMQPLGPLYQPISISAGTFNIRRPR